MLDSLYLNSYAKQIAPTYANDWACIYATSLEILGVALVSTSNSLLLDFCFDVDKVENPVSQTRVYMKI